MIEPGAEIEMIVSFRCPNTERIYHGGAPRAFPASIHAVAERKLTQLATVTRLADLAVPPGNRLEVLLGTRKGQHSIRINGKYRLCFRWQGSDAYDVEIVDYH